MSTRVLADRKKQRARKLKYKTELRTWQRLHQLEASYDLQDATRAGHADAYHEQVCRRRQFAVHHMRLEGICKSATSSSYNLSAIDALRPSDSLELLDSFDLENFDVPPSDKTYGNKTYEGKTSGCA